MDFKTLHEDWKTLVPGPFTEPENEVGYQEFLKIKEQGDIHHHHYAKGDNPDDKKKREKDAKAKAKEGEAKASDAGEAKPNGEGEAKAKPNGNGEEKKKLDPVGKEDGDIDNDGDQDKSDKYLAKKRKAIGKSIKAQKKTKNEKPIKLSGEKEKVELHKGKVDEEAELDEAAVRGKLRDLSQELAAYAKKHRSSVDKQYFEKIAQIAAAGKMPSAKDIDTDTEPRDFVLDMMAKSFPMGIMKNYKGVSPALDHALRKDPMPQDKSLEKKRNKGGLFYARHGEEVELGVPRGEEFQPDYNILPEAVLVNRDYKYDGKKIHISKKNFSKVHRDFKNPTKGKEMMITYDPKSGTVLVPVEFTEEVKEASTYRDREKEAKSNKKRHFAFGGKSDDKRWGKGGYRRGTRPNDEEVEVDEGWKKGKHKITDDKGKIISIHSSGSKAEREQHKLMQTDDHKKLTVTRVEEVELDEISKELKVRAYTKAGEKALSAQARRVKGDLSAGKEVLKRTDQRSKFYRAIFDKKAKKEETEWAKSKRSDKEMEDKYEKIHQERDKRYKAQRKKQEKKEGVEFDSKGKIKSLGFSFSDKVKKYNKKMQKSKDEMKKYKKEDAEVDEMSAIQKTSLNIHNQRVKLGIVKPGTKNIKKKESGVQKAAKHAGMSSAERSYLYNDSSAVDEAPSDYEDEIKKFKAGGGKVKKLKPGKKFKSFFKGKSLPRQEEVEEDEIDEMSKKLLYRAASKAEVQGREPERTGSDTGFGRRDPNIRRKRRAQAVKFVKGMVKAKEEVETEEVNTGNNRLRSLEKEIDKLHGRTKHMKHLKGKERDQMRDLSRQRDKLLKSRSIQGQFEETEIEEGRTVGSSGYDLYHKTFSDAMQHAYDHAKRKGVTVDPSEIDSKVATGPKKPSNNKTNRYILGTDKRQKVHIQVANLDNKRYELNMYIEEVQNEEDIKSRISNSPLVNKLYLMNQAKAIGKERAGPDKEHKISAWEDLAKKMGFNRRDYEEFGDNQGMYESFIPQEKGDMATKTRLKLEKVLGNRKKFVEPKERAGEEGTDKLSDNYKEATPGQDTVKEGNIIVNDRDPYRVFEHMVHYLMGTSIKNIEDYTFYRIDETPHNLRLENKEGALATITLADVQSFYDDQDMDMNEFIEMMEGFGVKELTEKGNSIIGDEGVPAIGKDKTGQGIYTTDPPKTFENIDIYSKFIQSNEERQKKGFVVN